MTAWADRTDEVFERYLDAWRLEPVGLPSIVTRSSRLLPVDTADGAPAMLKVAFEAEERDGARLMTWWGGDGAARVLASDGDALLIERATGERSLAEMASRGGAEDDGASRILCATAARLHAAGGTLPSGLVPLDRWFSGLFPAAERHGGLLGRCASVASELLAAPEDVVALHGDLHHGNVLDFGPRGWLAIDPKGLFGDRGFDHVNMFCNPTREIAGAPGRLARQVVVVSEAAGIERARLLRWILAWSGLSAVWMVEDGQSATLDLTVAEIAVCELDG